MPNFKHRMPDFKHKIVQLAMLRIYKEQSSSYQLYIKTYAINRGEPVLVRSHSGAYFQRRKL